MDEVRRGELHGLAADYAATRPGSKREGECFNAIVRWVEAREAEAYERAASTQARLMAWAPRKGAGDE